ncbi:DUF6214 family protein [Streptomyces cinerochromogenes]|uniref:DUF6214 family protein n=1 Tax=Streptomyces cinerochromogenes TaxID=66422 RepID=A0ABW7BH18_9ACTN
MLEASFLNLSDRNAGEGAVSVRPAWEVREHGCATSWFHVRLAFPDGAGVDALAVVHAGRVSVEDVKAQPPLSLTDLTLLADWLGGPLSEACGVHTVGAADADGTASASGTAEPDDTADTVGTGGTAGPDDTADTVGTDGAAEPDLAAEPDGAADVDGAGEGGERDHVDTGARCAAPSGGLGPVPVPVPVPVPGPEAGRRPGARRARQAWPRGIEGRRLVARQYRTAQDEGIDPVLAVMYATGRGRRRALRLIAQARDAGFLTPRHARR